MRFDSNRAWKDATQAVLANREVLLTLAGVFVVLPSFAATLLSPEPAIPAGITAQQAYAISAAYFLQAWPVLLAMFVAELIGTLAVLRLLTDRARPTVSEALRHALKAFVPVVAAQFMLACGMVAALVVPLALVEAMGGNPAGKVLLVFIVGFMFWVWVRASLLGPAVIADGVRNPWAALRRSFALTRRNTGRIAAFFLLFTLAIWIVVRLATAAIAVLATLAVDGESARVLTALVASAGSGVMMVYFAAVLAATHRQLVEPPAGAIAAPFD